MKKAIFSLLALLVMTITSFSQVYETNVYAVFEQDGNTLMADTMTAKLVVDDEVIILSLGDRPSIIFKVIESGINQVGKVVYSTLNPEGDVIYIIVSDEPAAFMIGEENGIVVVFYTEDLSKMNSSNSLDI
jgi:hypothetical protein